MREAANTSATMVGACTFMAQVSAGLPEAPNFMAAMKTTLGSFGRASTARRCSRSQAMVSTPAFSRLARTAGSEKRATPTTRLSGAARLAMRASVGPILPATPRTRMSPGTLARSATSSGVGSLKQSSSSATVAKRSGRGGVLMTFSREVRAHGNAGGRLSTGPLRPA